MDSIVKTNKQKKKEQYKKEIAEYVDKYNSTVHYKNKNTKNPQKLSPITSDFVFELRGACKLKLTRLNKIYNFIKQTGDPNFELNNIKTDPFSFIDYEPFSNLLTYEQADNLAKHFNLFVTEETRVEKFIISMFWDNNIGDNDIYIKKTKFLEYLNKYLKNKKIKLDSNFIKKIVDKVCIKYNFRGVIYYTTKYFNKIQEELTDTINSEYADSYIDRDIINIKKDIQQYQIDHSKPDKRFEFTSEQVNTINNLVNGPQKLKIVTGPPGTGKTTVVDCAITILQKRFPDNYENVLLTAPTGKATNNLIKSCSKDKCQNICQNIPNEFKCNLVKFIWSIFPTMIDYRENDRVNKIRDSSIEMTEVEKLKHSREIEKAELYQHYQNDLQVIDESSMITIFQLRDLMKYNEKLFGYPEVWFIGDVNQLEPIGGGMPYKNIIDSGLFEVNKLTEIKRFDGHLKTCIDKLTNNEIITEDDFMVDFTLYFDKLDSLLNKDNNIDKHKLYYFMNSNHLNITNTKILVSTNKGLYGVDSFNTKIQELFNRNDNVTQIGFNNLIVDTDFKKGDNIIKTNNTYDDKGKGYVNGDCAKIISQENEFEVEIKYDKEDESKIISIEELKEDFKLSYAFTIHKSQGDGYENIILIIPKEHSFQWNICDNSKNLIYTALSRAKQKCFVFGDYETFKKSQDKPFITRPSIFMDQEKIDEQRLAREEEKRLEREAEEAKRLAQEEECKCIKNYTCEKCKKVKNINFYKSAGFRQT